MQRVATDKGLLIDYSCDSLHLLPPTPLKQGCGVTICVYTCWVDKFIQIYYRWDMTLDALPKEVLQEVFLLEQQKNKLDTREKAQENFLDYAQHVYEGFIVGSHHKLLQKNWS